MFNKAEIMKRAHQLAKEFKASEDKSPSWASRHSYAEHFKTTLAIAWREAREAQRPNNETIKHLENKVLAIKCSVNRLQPNHRKQIASLEAEIQALAA